MTSLRQTRLLLSPNERLVVAGARGTGKTEVAKTALKEIETDRKIDVMYLVHNLANANIDPSLNPTVFSYDELEHLTLRIDTDEELVVVFDDYLPRSDPRIREIIRQLFEDPVKFNVTLILVQQVFDSVMSFNPDYLIYTSLNSESVNKSIWKKLKLNNLYLDTDQSTFFRSFSKYNFFMAHIKENECKSCFICDRDANEMVSTAELNQLQENQPEQLN